VSLHSQIATTVQLRITMCYVEKQRIFHSSDMCHQPAFVLFTIAYAKLLLFISYVSMCV